MSVFMCIYFIQYRIHNSETRRWLLNSHVLLIVSAFYGLHHWKIHTAHPFCDFSGNRVRLNLQYKREMSYLYN